MRQRGTFGVVVQGLTSAPHCDVAADVSDTDDDEDLAGLMVGEHSSLMTDDTHFAMHDWK